MSSNQKSRPAGEQGRCDGWMPGSAGNAHLDERVHAESAGVSALDPDDGAGTLAQGHSDAKQSRSRMQTFSNAWLMHPALMDARVKLTICMHGTNACQSDVDT